MYKVFHAQSEYVYPCNFTSPYPRYLISYSIVPLKYMRICFFVTQFSFLGSTMNLLKVLTAKHIYGMVLTKYIKDLISCLYKVRSTNYEYEFVTFFRLVIMGVAIGL